VQALLAHAGGACTPAIGNLPKLFRMHSYAIGKWHCARCSAIFFSGRM